VIQTRVRTEKELLAKSFLAFGGEFTLFAGLEECLKFVQNYKFDATDIDYLRTISPNYVETEFYNYLAAVDMNDVKIYAVPEGKNSYWNVKLYFLFCLSSRLCCISTFTFASYRRTDFESTAT
jgi:nicotinic acid phosphoribosyltransferase